ncbi:MAG: hypothetical protein ACTSQJ_06150 [Promethearchaeota archaeon]
MLLQLLDGLRALSKMGALFIVLLGIIWLIYSLHEATRRKAFLKRQVEEWDFDVTKFLAILSLSGFVVGALAILAGVSALILNVPPSDAYSTNTSDGRHWLTCVLLIILGILTFIKPLNDIPIAGLAGLLIASGICILIVFLIPDNAVEIIANYINPKLLLAIIFIIIFVITAIIVKFWTAGIMLVSKTMSWPPIAILIAIFCFVQGLSLLIAGVSIFG